MKRYTVELQFENGEYPIGRTIQVASDTGYDAIMQATHVYPEAVRAVAWIPGGYRGLDRTEETTVQL